MTATFGPIHGLGVRALGAVRSRSRHLDASRKKERLRLQYLFLSAFQLLIQLLAVKSRKDPYNLLPGLMPYYATCKGGLFWFSQAEEVPLTDGSLDGRAELIDMACSASLRIRPLKIRLWTG